MVPEKLPQYDKVPQYDKEHLSGPRAGHLVHETNVAGGCNERYKRIITRRTHEYEIINDRRFLYYSIRKIANQRAKCKMPRERKRVK